MTQTVRSWQTVSLGLQGVPFPTVMADGTLVANGSHIPQIMSTIPADIVNGIAFRNMPAPEHMPYFLRLLDSITNSGRRVFTFISEPGVGKSFMADVVSQMMLGQKALRYDCGDKRLSDLLFQTDITERTEQTVYDRVLAKAAEGKLHPLSIARLQATMGDAFDASSSTVDWNKLLLANATPTAIDEVFQAVALAEGINMQSTIALREQNGLIINAYEQDRVALADEYNKGKRGSDTALQTPLQWLGRDGVPDITVQSSSGRSYHMGNLDSKPGFYLFITGNSTTDGDGTFEFSQSQISRLQPSYLPKLTKKGLTHRFCQIMTGLPLSTLDSLYGAHFRNNKPAFVDFLRTLRFMGLDDQQIAKVPAYQLELIASYENTISAAANFASFFVGWENKMDPNSANIPFQLMAELTEDYVKRTLPDPRLFLKLFTEALERVNRRSAKSALVNPTRLNAQPLQSFDLATPDSTLRLGTAMMELLAEEITNKTQEQPSLRAILSAAASAEGLLPGQNGNNTLNSLLDVKVTPVTSTPETLGDIILAWADAKGEVLDRKAIAPFLPAYRRAMSGLMEEQDHFVTFSPTLDRQVLASASGPFALATTKSLNFMRKDVPIQAPDSAGNMVDTDKKETIHVLANDDEAGPFDALSRIVRVPDFLSSLLIQGNDQAFGLSYTAASRVPLKLQSFVLLLNDSPSDIAERLFFVIRSEAVTPPASSALAKSNDVRPATLIIGSGPIPQALQEQIALTEQDQSRRLLTYIDSTKKIDAPLIFDALRRDQAATLSELHSQICSVIKMQPVTQANQNEPSKDAALLKVIQAILDEPNKEAAVLKVIKGVLSGDLPPMQAYVAVSAPTRTNAARVKPAGSAAAAANGN